jgi:hypothetical protein
MDIDDVFEVVPCFSVRSGVRDLLVEGGRGELPNSGMVEGSKQDTRLGVKMSIKVWAEVVVYERNDKELPFVGRPSLMVKSHWNIPGCVTITTPDGDSYTVYGEDLKRAIDNCMRTK